MRHIIFWITFIPRTLIATFLFFVLLLTVFLDSWNKSLKERIKNG